MSSDRARKTAIGVGLAMLGFMTMILSPYAGVGAIAPDFPWSIVAYSAVFISGFVLTLYGAGLVLVVNNMWG